MVTHKFYEYDSGTEKWKYANSSTTQNIRKALLGLYPQCYEATCLENRLEGDIWHIYGDTFERLIFVKSKGLWGNDG